MIRFEPGNGKSNHFCLTLWIPGAWAETHGIQVGDQLLAIGGASVERWIAAQRQSAVGRECGGPLHRNGPATGGGAVPRHPGGCALVEGWQHLLGFEVARAIHSLGTQDNPN